MVRVVQGTTAHKDKRGKNQYRKMTGLYPQSQGDLGAIMGSQCTTGPQKRSWAGVEPHIHWTVSVGAVGVSRSSHGEQMTIREALSAEHWVELRRTLFCETLLLYSSCLVCLPSPRIPFPSLFFSVSPPSTLMFLISICI